MKMAQKTIFDPVAFEEKPAQTGGAGSGILGTVGSLLGGSGGAAFKMRRDKTHLELKYEETKQFAYLQDYPISGQLAGMYDEIRPIRSREEVLHDLHLSGERKVHRVVKPVELPDPAKQWWRAGGPPLDADRPDRRQIA
jgi:hypothetical protein